MTHIVITGVCGFVGRSLLLRLLPLPSLTFSLIDNEATCSFSQLSSLCDYFGYNILSSPRISIHKCDISDLDVTNLSSDIPPHEDVIFFHFAANTGVQPSILDPQLDLYSNVFGTFNLLQIARCLPTKLFIFASSCAPIGLCNTFPINENIPLAPISPYGASKASGEAYCSSFSASYGFPSIALRFSNLYGPYSSTKSSVVAKMISSAYSSGTIQIFGDGHQTRDFLFIDDLVDLFLTLMSSTHSGFTLFQLGTGIETRIIDLASLVSARLLDKFDISSDIVYSSPLPSDVPRNYSDITKVMNATGWSPHTSLDKGISTTVSLFPTDISIFTT